MVGCTRADRLRYAFGKTRPGHVSRLLRLDRAGGSRCRIGHVQLPRRCRRFLLFSRFFSSVSSLATFVHRKQPPLLLLLLPRRRRRRRGRSGGGGRRCPCLVARTYVCDE